MNDHDGMPPPPRFPKVPEQAESPQSWGPRLDAFPGPSHQNESKEVSGHGPDKALTSHSNNPSEQAGADMNYSTQKAAHEDFVLWPQSPSHGLPSWLEFDNFINDAGSLNDTFSMLPEAGLNSHEPSRLDFGNPSNDSGTLNDTVSKFDAPSWPPGLLETIPGAWPAAIDDGEGLQRTVPLEFTPLDAIMEELPSSSNNIVTSSDSPASSIGYEGVRQSPGYSLGFQSARESPAFSVGYGNVRQSPAYSIGFQSARPSPGYSIGYVSARESPFSAVGYSSAKQSPFENFGPSPMQNEIPQQTTSEYMGILGQKQLIPSVEKELNWSGRLPSKGQHVEFAKEDKVPLEDIGIIGSSLTAKITKVKCRRILLARKSMICGFHLKLKDALNEVEHLQRLRHAHIVRLVGSYIQGRNFSILIYPVTEYDLSTFMEHVTTILQDPEPVVIDYLAPVSLGRFFSCLANAMGYIHRNTIKHMDIKPQNILVKVNPRYSLHHQVYIADFGISRHFSSLDHSQTDSEIAKSPKYCAPEVYAEENWGRSADIFSLGCVFLEMQTVLCQISLEEFVEFRSKVSGRESFQLNLPLVHEWLDILLTKEPFVVFGKHSSKKKERNVVLLSMVKTMLSLEPEYRPLAIDILGQLPSNDCCRFPQEDFQSEPTHEEQEIDQINPHFKHYPKEMNLLLRTAVSNNCTAMMQQLLAVHTMTDDGLSGLLQIAVS